VSKTHILIVDDDSAIRFGVREYLSAVGHRVTEADSCASAHEAFRAGQPDLVLVDYVLPDGNAINLLKVLRALDKDVPVIVLTGHGSIDLAVQAIKEGAEYFLTKPLDMSSIQVVIERALEHRRHRRQVQGDQARRARRALNPFLGRTSGIRELEEQACRVAGSDVTVLILGETGAGKGVLAQWIHNAGPRAEEPWVDLNCAGLAKDLLESELFGYEKGAFTGAAARKTGLVEAAHRGTMFLDEVGDMDLSVQPKLLKVIEEQRFRRLGEVRERMVDVRFITATHQNLLQLAEAKQFRHDLLYRINVMTLTVPSLRDRREDIPILAADILRGLAGDMPGAQPALSPEAEQALVAYDWPGNVRELRNVLERAVLLSGKQQIRPDVLGLVPRPAAAAAPVAGQSLHTLQLQEITRTLKEEGGHVERAAQRLGIPRSTLYQKIRKYGLASPDGGSDVPTADPSKPAEEPSGQNPDDAPRGPRGRHSVPR